MHRYFYFKAHEKESNILVLHLSEFLNVGPTQCQPGYQSPPSKPQPAIYSVFQGTDKLNKSP